MRSSSKVNSSRSAVHDATHLPHSIENTSTNATDKETPNSKVHTIEEVTKLPGECGDHNRVVLVV